MFEEVASVQKVVLEEAPLELVVLEEFILEKTPLVSENELSQVHESPMSGLSKKFLWISWSYLLKTRQDKSYIKTKWEIFIQIFVAF